MTQVRVFSRKMRIPIAAVTVDCRAHWRAMRDDLAPFPGLPVGFEMDVDVTTDESPERVAALVNAARRGCFVEQTLGQANAVTHRLRVNDREWTGG